MHYTKRFNAMRREANRRGRSAPTNEELVPLIPADMCCPVCKLEMGWDIHEFGLSALITLQHWKDGSVGLICYSCNSSMWHNEVRPPEGMKRCSTCEEIKPVDQFSKSKHKRDGLHNECKVCSSRRASDWYHNNLTKESSSQS